MMTSHSYWNRAFLVSLLFMIACSVPEQKKQEIQTGTDEPQFEPYQEPFRPQYHFSPPANWMNDPNGMVFYKGMYHLFYQYYPDSTVWGPMHWGHAVSSDMVYWENLPIAIYPDTMGYIFSGSAVVDEQFSSGFGKKGDPALVAIFTYHNPKKASENARDVQSQGIAFSNDNGETWNKYDKNPVLESSGIPDFRDPKVMWHAPSKKWIMSLAVKDHIEFYSSPDLKMWKKESEFGKDKGAHGGVWECPDLFTLKVDDKDKWVLLVSINPGGPNGGSATQYFVGDFDGKQFNLEYPLDSAVWLDWGKDNYAGVTWSNIPEEDGRRLFLGWMSNWEYGQAVPTKTWRSAMTLPRSLGLVKTTDGYLLTGTPVEELKTLREDHAVQSNIEVSDPPVELDILDGTNNQFELKANISLNMSKKLEVKLSNREGEQVTILINTETNELVIDRTRSGNVAFESHFPAIVKGPLPPLDQKQIDLHLFVDKASMEIFINKGQLQVTNLIFPDKPYNKLLISADSKAVIDTLERWNLTSIWQ
ncbi:glycoside hydrolase family 32 protein [Limibacter armeniacum]|uniref:glycoside hydrolase family 32 protein n=1 Tax=Limibacter armeniacum TaxID=466084 RepID=UPI002FE4FEC7